MFSKQKTISGIRQDGFLKSTYEISDYGHRGLADVGAVHPEGSLFA